MNVLITGGSRGIGKAIAIELAKAGHNILIVARDKSNLKFALNEINKVSNSLNISFNCDVSKVDEQLLLLKFCKENNFLPDVLILNAGIFIEGSLLLPKNNAFENTLNVNFFSNYHLVNLFLDTLKSALSAKIILIGSTAAYEPYPIGSLYGVSKWALRGYAVNLRNEMMKENIAVTFIAPGGTLTDLWAGETLPENRLLEPSDIGKLIAAILTLSNQAVVEELIVRPMLGDIHE